MLTPVTPERPTRPFSRPAASPHCHPAPATRYAPRPHHLEASRGMELALHHIEEDGDGGFAQFRLGKERHFQHGADHFRNELYLVLTLNKETHYSEIEKKKGFHNGLRRPKTTPRITVVSDAGILGLSVRFSPAGIWTVSSLQSKKSTVF